MALGIIPIELEREDPRKGGNVDEWMDDRAERPGARVWSPRPSPGQLGMSQEGPDWATERERNTENLKTPLTLCMI